jgi:hypothetical protein
VSNESRGQQETQSLHAGYGYSPPRSPPTAPVRVPIPSLIGPSAPPARAGLNSLNQQKSRLPSALGSLIAFDPPRPCGALYLPHGSVLIPMGLTASGEILHPDHVSSSHLSRSHELPRRFCGTPEQSGTCPHVAEDIAADSTTSTQHKAPTSDFLDLGELPSQVSAGRCNSFGNSYAKIPLFLPSQTPNRDPSRDILPPQGSSLTHEWRRLSQGSPIHCSEQSQPDCPRSDHLHSSALRHVDMEVHLGVEGEIPLHGSRSVSARTFAATNSTLPLQWPDRPATDACPTMLSAESSHCPPRYQSASLSSTLGKRGSVTHEAITTGPRAQGDTDPSGTSVSA